MNGYFSFPKTNTLFSWIALDQLHEQNNKVIKGISSAISVINRKDESALNRWALSGPELAEIISQFENEYKQKMINHYRQQKITMNAESFYNIL